MLSSTFDGVARVAARLPPTAISSNATLSTASWSRSCSLKFTRACEDGKRVRLLAPPCVTRWSGGAVSHHRRIAAAAGAAKQLIMLLNLEVNITAGSLTSCPGRCFWHWLSLLHALAGRRAATCCRRARRASLFGGDGPAAAARRRLHCSPLSAAWLPTAAAVP